MDDKVYYCMYCERFTKGELHVVEIKSRHESIPCCDNCGDLASTYITRRKYPFTDAMVDKPMTMSELELLDMFTNCDVWTR